MQRTFVLCHPVPKLLSHLCETYQAFLIDICGVLHDGNALFPWTQNTLDYLTTQKKTVIFFSNTGHSSENTCLSLAKKGLKGRYTTLTSGDVVKEALHTQYANKTIYVWGEMREYIPQTRCISMPNHADIIVLTAFLPDTAPDDSWDAWILDLPVRPIICVNPDVWAPQGQERPKRRCGGFLANRVKNLRPDIPVHFFGKPYAPIYEKVLTQNLAQYARKDILAVGDTLTTDIIGANQWQIDTWWIHPVPLSDCDTTYTVTYTSPQFQ